MVSDNEDDARNKPNFGRPVSSSPSWRIRWTFGHFVLAVLWCIGAATANRPPQFLTGAQTEIVLRLKEGVDSPAGRYLWLVKWLKVCLKVVQTKLIFFIQVYRCRKRYKIVG